MTIRGSAVAKEGAAGGGGVPMQVSAPPSQQSDACHMS